MWKPASTKYNTAFNMSTNTKVWLDVRSSGILDLIQSLRCESEKGDLHRLVTSDSSWFMDSKFVGSVCSFVSSTILLRFSSSLLSLCPRFS